MRRVRSRADWAATRARAARRPSARSGRPSRGFSSNHSAKLLVGSPLDQRPDRDVAQLGLGLALELGVLEAHRDDGGQPLPDVLAEEVLVLLLQRALGPGVLVDHVGEGLLEALPRASRRRWWRSRWRTSGCSRSSRCSTAGRPRPPWSPRSGSYDPTLRNSASFDVFRWRTKSMMPSWYWKVWDALPSGRSSTKRISRPLLRKAITWSRSMTVWARNSISSKMAGSGQKRDGGTGASPGRRAGHLQLAGRPATVDELHLVVVAVAVDLEQQPLGQGVDHRHPDSVEAAGHLVAAAVPELAAGVQHGQHDFGRRACPCISASARWGYPGRRRSPGPPRRPAGSRRCGWRSRPWPRPPSCPPPPTPGGEARSGRWIRCTSRAVCGPGPDPPTR